MAESDTRSGYGKVIAGAAGFAKVFGVGSYRVTGFMAKAVLRLALGFGAFLIGVPLLLRLALFVGDHLAASVIILCFFILFTAMIVAGSDHIK